MESNKKNISEEFLAYVEKDIQYFAAKEKIYYARRYASELIKEKNNYFDFLDSIIIQESQGDSYVSYLDFIDNYINYLYLKKIWGTGADYKNDFIEKYYIAKSELSGEPLEQFLTENFVLGLHSSGVNETFMKLLNEYISGDNSEKSKNILKQNLAKNKESKIAIGKSAPDFSLTNIHNQLYTLSTFKKDYIVLDLWASWCGPCRRAIPEMKAISENHKDIAQFVFISIDSDTDNWKTACKQLKLPEPSLLIDSLTRVNYGFYDNISIPFYIVINDKGKVVLSNTTKEDILSLLDN